MRLLRRLLFFIGLLGAMLSIVLLLNFTAPNPTGRRYSSEIPLMGKQYSPQAVGDSGEKILSEDLGVSNNNLESQRQCLCNTKFQNTNPPRECNICTVYSSEIANYRKPDFMTEGFLAESKNRENLLYSYSDQVSQIRDYVIGAKSLNRPLWLYTRVDTLLNPQFNTIVESTGGKVVPYFTYPGYIDPVDLSAWRGLAISLALMVFMLTLGFLPPRKPSTGGVKPKSPRTPADVMREAREKTDELGRFKDRANELARHRIDIEDSRDE